MKNVRAVIIAISMLVIANACSRKTNPSGDSTRSVYGSGKTSVNNSPAAVAKRKARIPVPKVIVVNDSVAKKTFDGRYYYDLDGHRYWRNKNDGKYYLFNKSMTGDPAFKYP